jgi:hypothetical protein
VIKKEEAGILFFGIINNYETSVLKLFLLNNRDEKIVFAIGLVDLNVFLK